MSPPRKATTVRERYDQALHYARDQRLPPDAPRPRPTSHWPEENVQLLERFHAWLISGGACEYSTNIIYLPVAGHVLGLNLAPHEQLDLESDLEKALVYVRAKGVGEHWVKACRNGLNKFRRFLRLERGLGEVQKETPYDVAAHTQGLPAWLVRELVRYQRVQQRNWRPARIEGNIRRFWSGHLRVWRFLCEQRGVQDLGDVRRQHLLDYIDQRLDAGYAVSGVNNDVRTFHSFLRFLEQQGYAVPQALLRIPGLKPPDNLPKYLTDEQVRKLRDDLEERVAQARLSNHRRDALLDRAAFYLLWQCGLRVGEVEELRLDDLDLPNRKLAVRNSKGLKDRVVFLSDRVVLALGEYLAVRGVGSGEHVFLFRNAPLRKDLIRDRIKAAGKRTSVRVTPHRLRHTCATQLLNAGCRVTSIQKFLGHKRLNSTMIYARVHDHTVAEDYYAAMERIEQRLNIGSPPEEDHAETPVNGRERAQLLELAARLAKPELGVESRLNLVEKVRQVLNHSAPPDEEE